MRSAALAPVFACVCATAAYAGDLGVTVKDDHGQPVANAVVMVTPQSGGRKPAAYDAPLQMAQKGMQFQPFVLIVPQGAEVAFPNQDPFRHQVYSFSPAKSFELKLYGGGQAPKVRFDKPGVVALGCNIHDTMTAFIKVTDAPYAARTDAQGRVVLKDLPGGQATVRVWHPYLKGAEQAVQVALTASGHAERAFTVALRTPPMRMADY